MNKTNKAILLGLSVLFVSRFAFAGDPVVSIPLKTFINPTFDLVDQNGNKMNSSDLDLKFRQGVDLSKLNPVENKYWQNQKFPAIDTKLSAEMPDINAAEVIYSESLGAYREAELYSIYVSPKKDPSVRYGMTFGLQIHSSLIKAALLRKVGIYQESPKYFNKMKVRFESNDQMNEFVQKAFLVDGSPEDTIDYLSLEPFQRGIISDVNKDDHTLIIHDSYLEKLNPEVPSLFDGLTPATQSNLNLFAQSRAFRSLIVPYVIADLGESLNRVSPQSATLRGGSVELSFINNQYFKEKTSEADAKWILRRIADLTDKDWDDIVQAGAFPKQFQSLVKMKLMYRMKNMMENFFTPAEQAQLMKATMPSLSVNSDDGCVVDSKVMAVCANVPGYPERWAHGDRQSPFETADLIKYLGIKAQASTLKAALGALNEKLQKNKTTQNITGIEFTDKGIAPLGSATLTTASLNYNADRIITTGTYYGSQAPIQLVDNVTITGAISYQKLLFQAGGIMKNFGANVGYNRDFTYVTPIKTIDEAKKQSWGNLYFESKLGKVLEPLTTGKGLTSFLANLKEGEVFTITDSVGVMGRAGVTAIIDNLIGFTALGTPSVGLSVDANKSVILRQVQVTRTAEGIQVFVRDGNAKAYGIQFDVNYFINLLKIRAQTTTTDLHTEAYIINYQADLMKKIEDGEIKDVSDDLQKTVDAQKALGDKATQAILALLKQSNISLLRDNFGYQRYDITHGLKTKEIQTKLLWFRSTKSEEEHILSVFKPQMVAPTGTVQNKVLQFSLYSKGALNGTDPVGTSVEFGDAVLSKVVGKNAPQFSQTTQNPSQSLYGKAYWRTVRADADLNTDRSMALQSVAVVDHVWSGWSASKAQLQSIMQELRNSLKNISTDIAADVKIPDGALYQTKKIDFYRISSHLTLLPAALDKIKELMVPPAEETVEKQKIGLLKRLVHVFTGGPKVVGDDMVFKNLMKIIGNGDEALGLQTYKFECQQNHTNNSGDMYQQGIPTSTWYKGTNYDCLESWTAKLIKLSRNYPTDVRAQNRWMADVLFVLDEKIPQAYLLNQLGKDKFIYYIDFAGFRVGDEDGDDGIYTPFVLGEPTKKSDYGNGLVSLLAGKFKVQPTELMTTRASFQ